MDTIGGWFTALSRRWRPSRQPEPGAALFRGLRLRLTLWYSGVLAASLLIVGVGLYIGLEDRLLQPVTSEVSSQMDLLVRQWQRDPGHACGPAVDRRFGGPPPFARTTSPVPIYAACFATNGQLLQSGPGQIPGSTEPPESFLREPLFDRALRNGSASDFVSGGTGIGTVYRAARVARDPVTGTVLGVVQVGRSVQDQASALALLRTLLMLLGLAALVVATAGGLFLSRRALVPAHLAFARQQSFVADASHELRTPLTLLRTNAEVLLRHRERLAPEDAELLDDIVAESAYMDRLTSDLLLLARLDAGHLHLEREVVDLFVLASDVARRMTPVAEEKGVAIAAPGGARPLLVGDSHAIERAALILLDNAVKYTPAGGTVTLRTAESDGNASLLIEDTGIGISPEHLSRLSERFYRVDRARARESGGAGLGLAIAQGIAAAHGGALRISSQPGKGTTATLVLPLNGSGRKLARDER